MTDEPARQESWDWDAEARRFGVSPDGHYNAGTMTLPSDDAHVWYREDGSILRHSGEELTAQAKQMSAVLAEIGVEQGDRVAGLMGRRPEVFITALAVWRIGAVYVPLFSGFGGESLRVRLEDSETGIVVADADNRPALRTLGEKGMELTVVAVDGEAESGDIDLPSRLDGDPEVPEPADTHLNDTATIMYTSGTTGRPKGCMMPHGAVLALVPYVRHCLNQGQGDVLFAGADAGWSFGLLTTGFAPMSAGVSRVTYEGPFDAEGWWDCVQRTNASHVASAPTAFRKLAAAGPELVPSVFSAATSAGEPMDAATNSWFVEHAGVHIHDSYGLSELGMVTGNLRGEDADEPVAGSMGVALPGFDVRLLDDNDEPVGGEGTGRLAVRDNGHFLSNGYWGRMDEWEDQFIDDWFVTEDVVKREADGRYTYVARNDDIIVTSGYNVAPPEVETALLEHPAVDDAAVVGESSSGTTRTIVAAHVVLSDDAGHEITEQLRPWVGERVGWHAAPRRVEVHDELPHTASGKIMRRRLREGSADTKAAEQA